MVTGTSTAKASIILLDARKGVIEQTKRHFFITQLLGIKHIIFAINKMDLVDYKQEVFKDIKATLANLVDKHGNKDASYHYIPLSALYNENIVSRSKKLDWHKGEALLHLMEAIPLESNKANDGVFQIQYVIRPKEKPFMTIVALQEMSDQEYLALEITFASIHQEEKASSKELRSTVQLLTV